MPKKCNAIAKVGYDVLSFDGEGRLLTTTEAAEFLHLSASSLNKWRVAGRGPAHVRLEGAVRYRPRDLIKYLEACGRQSTSEV